MNRSIWNKIRGEFAIWRTGALPGILVIGLILFLRLTSSLQFLEWWALDYFLRLRPDELTDKRILIVGIDEADIQRIGTYPIPDRDLANLIETLQTYQPTAIGVDIVRDLPITPGHTALAQVFAQRDNVFGIEKALPDDRGSTIDSPPNLPPERVGFADIVLDKDGSLRRSLIGTWAPDRTYKFSLALLLSEHYLLKEGYRLENGIRDRDAMRFGTTELTRVQPNSGGYIDVDANGNQILINYRRSETPFHVVSMMDVLNGNVPAEWIRDRIVLIGVMTSSTGDWVQSSAVGDREDGLIYGVESHAHVISQILSAVLENRPLLQTWSDGWEYLWIIGWGIIGILLGRFLLSPFKILAGLGIASAILLGYCYGMIILGWWIPVVPALGVLLLNSAGLTAAFFYHHYQSLKDKIQDRQLVIEQTFDAIHNGPLQTLARLRQDLQDHAFSQEHIYLELDRLNRELRTVYESVQQETITSGNSLYFCGETKLDLQHSIHELLHEVYRTTLTRDFPHFKTLKLKVIAFENIDNRCLSSEQKRGLCRFLEEALCNAGKYAIGMTRLDVSCKSTQGKNVIRIVDNGTGLAQSTHASVGRGTQQANHLARQLGGTFQRSPNVPKGVVCEFSYPVVKPWFRRF